MTPNPMIFSVSASLASCIGLVLMAYNVIALVMFMREDSEGSASGLAKGAWALGLVSAMFAGLPCIGIFLPILAIILARVERGKIYRDESPLAGATPVRMGSVNGNVALLIWLIVNGGLVTSFMVGSGGE